MRVIYKEKKIRQRTRTRLKRHVHGKGNGHIYYLLIPLQEFG